jgi:hypothetical protein
VGLGRRSTIFTAEMLALALASSKATSFARAHSLISNFIFFADNSSSIQSIFNTHIHPSQSFSIMFHNNVSSFLDSSPQTQVTVAWVPSHSGIVGNERADVLAKHTTPLPSAVGATFSYLRHCAKRHIKSTWKTIWEKRNKSGQFDEVVTTPPSPSVPDHFRSIRRETYGRITQILTGHGYIGEFYMRFILDETPWCPCTDENVIPTLQDRHHLIFDCPRYESHRHILRKRFLTFDNPSFTLKNIIEHSHGHTFLAEFLEKSGAFTKRGIPFPDPPEPPPAT